MLWLNLWHQWTTRCKDERKTKRDKSSIFKFSKTCSTILFVSAVFTPGSLLADKCLNFVASFELFPSLPKIISTANPLSQCFSRTGFWLQGCPLRAQLAWLIIFCTFCHCICILMCQAGVTVLPLGKKEAEPSELDGTGSALALCGK